MCVFIYMDHRMIVVCALAGWSCTIGFFVLSFLFSGTSGGGGEDEDEDEEFQDEEGNRREAIALKRERLANCLDDPFTHFSINDDGTAINAGGGGESVGDDIVAHQVKNRVNHVANNGFYTAVFLIFLNSLARDSCFSLFQLPSIKRCRRCNSCLCSLSVCRSFSFTT